MWALEIILLAVIVLVIAAAVVYRHEWRKEARMRSEEYFEADIAFQQLSGKYHLLVNELAVVKAELELYKNHEAETRVLGQKVRISTPGGLMQGAKAAVATKGIDWQVGDRFEVIFTHEGELYRCWGERKVNTSLMLSSNPEQIIPALDNYEAHVIKL